MRASLPVPCALAIALLAGCKDARRTAPTTGEDAGAHAVVAPPAVVERALLTDPDDEGASIYAPAADGQVAPVIRDDAPNMRYARLGRDACLAELGRRGIAYDEAPPTSWASTPRLPPPRAQKSIKKKIETHAVRTKPRRTSAASSGAASKRAKPPGTKKPAAKHVPAKRATPKHAPAQDPASPSPSDDASTQVLAPVRLRGPLHGIRIHSALSEKQRERSTIEIVDCRLVLALDDFSAMLAKRDVVEVIHMSAFRSQRDRGCTPKYPGKQHCGALALDVGTFKKKDGSVLDVDKDFNGRIGTATCTEGTGPSPATPAAAELWDIVCDSARRGLFHVILTPNFNVEHKNHFHLEVTPEVRWMLVK